MLGRLGFAGIPLERKSVRTMSGAVYSGKRWESAHLRCCCASAGRKAAWWVSARRWWTYGTQRWSSAPRLWNAHVGRSNVTFVTGARGHMTLSSSALISRLRPSLIAYHSPSSSHWLQSQQLCLNMGKGRKARALPDCECSYLLSTASKLFNNQSSH